MQKPKFDIVIIGSGNMANALGKLFSGSHRIVQIISRNKKTGSLLAKNLKSVYTNSLKDIITTADFYFLCVPDDKIADISSSLKNIQGMVVHHSGSKPLTEIKCKNKGVLYPFSSIQANSKLNHPALTFFYQTGHKSQALLINSLCIGYKFKLHHGSDKVRSTLHLCAVLVNNFTNHIYSKTIDLIEKNKDFHPLLVQLAQQALTNFEEKTSKLKQTGPARRGDKKTMNVHFDLIKKDKYLSKIYLSLSQSIQNTYNHE